MLVSLAALALVAASHIGVVEANPPAPKPWRSSAALAAPDWFQLGLSHRTRFEHLQDDFRSGAAGNATALSVQTLLTVGFAFEHFAAGVELADSRPFASDEALLNTTMGNPLDLLQAWIGLRRSSLLLGGDLAEAKLGRITMDVGSRRLVARNLYRNTINAFTGADLKWTSPKKYIVRAFAAVPITRLPSEPEALADGRLELDEENLDTLLSGAFISAPALFAGVDLELFVLGLREDDGELKTQNRRLVTPGFRLHSKPSAGELDFQAEAALQLGASRASTAATDTKDLEHRAFFGHAELGVTFGMPWKPRVAVQYDHASGDDKADDDVNGRFDTLFGARRFDFGPTGIYGAFARSNLSTPGLRLEVKPTSTVDTFAAHRLFWLASPRDAWTSAGLRDPTGGSGSFIGQQVEGSIRWHVLPKNLALELGAAHLLRGDFAKDAAGAREAPATFLYTQVSGTI